MSKSLILSSSVIAVLFLFNTAIDSSAYNRPPEKQSQKSFMRSFFSKSRLVNGVIVNIDVESEKHSLKSAISGFSYGLGLAADFKKYKTELKLGYSLSKAKLHNAELIYSFNPNYKLGASLTYGSGENSMRVQNPLSDIDVKNKQTLFSGMISAYYQFPPLYSIYSSFGLGIGMAKHTMKLNTEKVSVPDDKKYSYKDNYTSFAYGAFLSGISNINKYTAVELSYNISGFGSKKRSMQLKNSPDIIELQKAKINHSLTLGVRVLL